MMSSRAVNIAAAVGALIVAYAAIYTVVSAAPSPYSRLAGPGLVR
jgi:hypothetical protein